MKTDKAGRIAAKLRGAGGFRLHARHRGAAGRPPADADRVQHRHDDEAAGATSGPLGTADRGRGPGHRLARARRQLGAALRQQIYRLHVGDDDQRHRALQRAGDRPCRPACPRSHSHRFRLALSQHAAVAGAGPAAVQARFHHHAGRAGAAAAARAAGAEGTCARCRRRASWWRRRPSRGIDQPVTVRARASSRARPTRSTGTPSSATA